jgi:NAD(P)-dependent dehydrogenase (short-subunit alcohol dehydrogenase family)
MAIHADLSNEEDVQGMFRRVIEAYGSVGNPGDVGKVGVWLASDAADHLTGATLEMGG